MTDTLLTDSDRTTYRRLRTYGLRSSTAFYVLREVKKAERIGLDFEDSPFEVEYKGRTLTVETTYDEDADTSYLEDVPREDWPEWHYGLVVSDPAFGVSESLWSIEYDGRTESSRLSSLAHLYYCFEDLADTVVRQVHGRTSHG